MGVFRDRIGGEVHLLSYPHEYRGGDAVVFRSRGVEDRDAVP